MAEEKKRAGRAAPSADRQAVDAKGHAAVENLDEYEAKQRVSKAQEVFDLLLKAIKNISIYRHNVGHYGEYLARTHQVLTTFLELYHSLPLHIESVRMKYLDQIIYEEEATEQNHAARFYRDGVRFIIFRNGLTAEELLNFVLIMLANFKSPEYVNEDTVSLMWKQEFSNVEYVVVDSFSVGMESEEQARAEVDKIVNYLYSRMTSDSDDSVASARISLEDLEIELEDIEQAKGVVIKGSPATEEEKSKVRTKLLDEQENRMMPKLVQILFRVFEEELDQDLRESIQEVFIQMLDSFLIHEDFRSINQLLKKCLAMEHKNIPPGNLQHIQHIESIFVAKMAEPERIARVGEVLNSTSEIKEPHEVYRYLVRLDLDALPSILQTLENMERLEGRRLFCDALATMGAEHLDLFQRRLSSTKANVVRDMVYIIDKLNPPDKYRIFASLLKHPNLAIRLEALNTIGAHGDNLCRAYVMKALDDPDTQMRITAARLLPNFDLGMATRTILGLIQNPAFSHKEPPEQTAMYAALAMTNTPEAIGYLRQQLHESNLLNKKKITEHKRIVVNGLALSGSIAAYKLLKTELEGGIKEEEVAQLAKHACDKLRERLLGHGLEE